MRRTIVVLAVMLVGASATAQTTPDINWGSAGKITAPKLPELPQDSKKADDSGFDCRSRTRLAMEQGGLDRDPAQVGPSTVQSCSRDGFTIEVAPMSN